MKDNISVWEDEGGSLNEVINRGMTGSAGQIESAERIGAQVNGEFDRVSNALQAMALKQSDQGRLTTFAIMLILEEKRGEVLANERAGYVCPDWQELHDQVRKWIMNDPQYKAIKQPGQSKSAGPA